jgi:hypothetical protein
MTKNFAHPIIFLSGLDIVGSNPFSLPLELKLISMISIFVSTQAAACQPKGWWWQFTVFSPRE